MQAMSTRRHFAALAALALFAAIVAAAWQARAQERKHVRITVARSVSGIPLWGIGPFAEKAGFRVEYIPAGITHQLTNVSQHPVRFLVVVWK